MDIFRKHLINGKGEINWKNLFLTALGAWVAYAVIVTILFQDLERSGQFGDMFGGINALFSGLALIGVVVAIFYQRSELKLQRKELELTRLEMENQREEMKGQKEQLEGQKKILDKQHETASIQQFENAFYQMLRSHNDLNSSMYKYRDDNYYDPVIVGNALFEVFYHKSNDVSFDEAHGDYNEQIIPYLYRIERMLDFIHRSSGNNKDMYVSVLRSTCTSCELKVIELYLRQVEGFGPLRLLLKEYGFWYILDYSVPPLRKSGLV